MVSVAARGHVWVQGSVAAGGPCSRSVLLPETMWKPVTLSPADCEDKQLSESNMEGFCDNHISTPTLPLKSSSLNRKSSERTLKKYDGDADRHSDGFW